MNQIYVMFPKTWSSNERKLSFVLQPIIEVKDVCQSCHPR